MNINNRKHLSHCSIEAVERRIVEAHEVNDKLVYLEQVYLKIPFSC